MVESPAPTLVNGGFPEPPLSEPVIIVSAVHGACGNPTGIRLPTYVPVRAVRRMHCPTCNVAFDAGQVEELGLMAPEARQAVAAAVAAAAPTAAPRARTRRRRPAPKLKLPAFDPQGRAWQYASVPLGALAVVAALALLQGGDERSPATQAVLQSAAASELTAESEAATDAEETADAAAAGAASGADLASKPAKNTKLVRGSTYSLALPAGWERVAPVGGATFAAAAPGGEADVQLWIDEDPELDFPTFISQSMTQLEALAGSAQMIERIPAPTPEATIVRLAADAPADQPSYEVTLRVAGPYRYYLASSVQPDASAAAGEGADLVAGSFTPELGG